MSFSNLTKSFIKINLLYEHRLVIEKHLGRYLSTNEVVHHIDGNKSNNSLENLQLMTNEEHSRFHNKLRRKKVI